MIKGLWSRPAKSSVNIKFKCVFEWDRIWVNPWKILNDRYLSQRAWDLMEHFAVSPWSGSSPNPDSSDSLPPSWWYILIAWEGVGRCLKSNLEILLALCIISFGTWLPIPPLRLPVKYCVWSWMLLNLNIKNWNYLGLNEDLLQPWQPECWTMRHKFCRDYHPC